MLHVASLGYVLNISEPCTGLGSAKPYTGKVIKKGAANPTIERRRNDDSWFLSSWSAMQLCSDILRIRYVFMQQYVLGPRTDISACELVN